MKTIGIRELRQNASVYVSLVRRGESIQVTDRGRPVAMLVPIPEGGTVEHLVAEGRLTAPSGDLLELGPGLVPIPGSPSPSDVLAEMRASDR